MNIAKAVTPVIMVVSILCTASGSVEFPTIKEQLLEIKTEKPNTISFDPVDAKFIRFVIYGNSNVGACLDELEVYGVDKGRNLALSANGSKAAASSCIFGYAIHKIEHLNDGRYGNQCSWIAAGGGIEWAQIELARVEQVSMIIFSRDREGKLRDRLPTHVEIRLSVDGKTWTTVSRVRDKNSNSSAYGWLPVPETWDDMLQFAFLAEQEVLSNGNVSESLPCAARQMEDMINRFDARKLDVTEERARLASFQKELVRLTSVQPADVRALQELCQRVRLAKRGLLFRDPDLAAIGNILFVKRYPFEPSHNYSVLLDGKFRAGGGICKLEIPKVGGRMDPSKATVKLLFDSKDGMARTPSSNYQADKIFFSYRPSPSGFYRIMVMGADGENVRQLTDGTMFHDFWPCPLPDGGLAFISTRCRARFLCWRPQTFVLFRSDGEGSNIRPLSFANLSEWAPSVMRDGRIIWTRSEYLDKGADFGHTLWSIRPDGTHPELVFGNNTIHAYANGREVPGTTEICCILACHAGDLNGPVALVDVGKGRYNPEAINILTPEVKPAIGMSGSWPRTRCFRDPIPVSRDYILCSHSPGAPFGPGFGIYVIDRYGNREIIYFDNSISSICPTPLMATTPPPMLADAGTEMEGTDRGQFFLADVYQGLEPEVKRGSVKYIRVCEEIRSDLAQLPNGQYRSDHEAFQDFYATPVHKVSGPFGWPAYVAKGTHGVVPVNEDGSAAFWAPAGKTLYFQALDENFNEIQRMRSVIQLQPGERRSCVGCHEPRDSAPPRRVSTASRSTPSELIAPSWGTEPFSYEKVVQPVWDAKCVKCHNDKQDEKMKEKQDLRGILDKDKVPASYRTLISLGWVNHFDCRYGQRHFKAPPYSFGSLKSKLWKVLDKGHYEVKLTTDEMQRVKCWIDMNCPLWPDYQYRPDRPDHAVSLTKAE